MAEKHSVILVFDNNGELEDVKPGEGGNKTVIGKPGQPLDIARLTEAGMKQLQLHPFLYGFGSPGCVVFKTSNGYIRICW